MYEAFYGLTEKPFSIIPDPSFMYLSRQHALALDVVEYGLINQSGFNIITGGIGTGKTTLIRFIVNQISRDINVGLISNTHGDFDALFEWVLFALGLDHRRRSEVEMFGTLVEYLVMQASKGRGTLLIIDEAQNLTANALERLRMLSNVNADKDLLLQMLLVGQVGLRETLRRPELEQFAQRIAAHYHLDPLNAEETRTYIRHRLRHAGAANTDLFDDVACLAIHRHSGGVPRVINLLCDTALVYGYAEGRPTIDVMIVEAVAHDRLSSGLFRSSHQPAVAPRVVSGIGGGQGTT